MHKKPLQLAIITSLIITTGVAYALSDIQLSCERDALLRKLDRENTAYARYADAVNEAKRDRREGYAFAYSIADSSERKNETREVERQYKQALRDARNTQREEDRDAKDEYYDERRACREEQKDRCERIQCSNKTVPRCDSEGNPINYTTDPCGGDPRSSSSRSSRSSGPVCGDGICEGTERAVACPICAEGTPPELCRCRYVCETDCGIYGSSSSSSRYSSSSRSIDQCYLKYCPCGCRNGQCQQCPRSSSSSSSRTYCGDGKCEGNEGAIVCPSCAQGTPPELCRCRQLCEADCS